MSYFCYYYCSPRSPQSDRLLKESTHLAPLSRTHQQEVTRNSLPPPPRPPVLLVVTQGTKQDSSRAEAQQDYLWKIGLVPRKDGPKGMSLPALSTWALRTHQSCVSAASSISHFRNYSSQAHQNPNPFSPAGEFSPEKTFPVLSLCLLMLLSPFYYYYC